MVSVLKYYIGSRSFLDRAEQHIAAFESSRSVADFFYAALQLRFGIEARLQEYLDATLKQRGLDPDESSEPAATRILRRLAALAPESEYAVQLRIFDEDSGTGSQIDYTPVTRELAKMHGRLGELLHFKFFVRNRALWFVDADYQGPQGRTIVAHVTFLRSVADELRKATRGTLLTHLMFTRLLDDTLATPGGGTDEPVGNLG